MIGALSTMLDAAMDRREASGGAAERRNGVCQFLSLYHKRTSGKPPAYGNRCTGGADGLSGAKTCAAACGGKCH